MLTSRIGRGTTLNAGMAIAYATLDYILTHIACRTLFATHYHELARMLGADASTSGESNLRPGVSFFCTDVDDACGAFAYAYRLRPGINYDSHAIMAAQLAGMPGGFLDVARRTLDGLEGNVEREDRRGGQGEVEAGVGVGQDGKEKERERIIVRLVEEAMAASG